MSKENLIEVASWIITLILLLLLVPVFKIREAILIFLFKQIITWLFGHLVVHLRLIKYPHRFFLCRATKTSFTFDFFVYPALCVLFNLYYPFNTGLPRQFLHYFLFTSGITILEVIFERKTQLIKYLNWKWYWTWVTLFITFMMSNLFYRWFFNLN